MTVSQHPRKRDSTAEHGQRRDLRYPDVPEALAVPSYDNHTHLEIEDGEAGIELEDHLELAAQAGVVGAITVGGDVPSSQWQVRAANAHARLLAAVAIHPNEAPRYAEAGELEQALEEIAGLAQDTRVAAIGETGLDYFRTSGDDALRAQHASFEAHIDIAKRERLPMQIHDRDAHDDVVALLRRVGAPEGTVFHCFSGGPALAQIAADEGWYCSFAGNVTFKNAQLLRDALQVVPRERILVETDAPFLTPVPFRGRPNAPYLIPVTIRFMADELGVEADELAAQLAQNTLDLYGPFEVEQRAAWRAARRG